MHPLSCNPPLFHCSRNRCKKLQFFHFSALLQGTYPLFLLLQLSPSPILVCCTDYKDGGFSCSSFSSFLSRSETENGRFGVWRVSQSEKSRGEKKIVWEEGGPLNSGKKRIYFSPPFEIPQKQQAMRRMAAFALQPDRRKRKKNLQEIPPSQFREEEKTSKHHVLTHSPFLPATKMRPVFFSSPPPFPLAACHRVCSPPHLLLPLFPHVPPLFILRGGCFGGRRHKKGDI